MRRVVPFASRLLCAFGAAAIAGMTAVVVSVYVSEDDLVLEVAGLGLICALLVLPAIIIYLVLDLLPHRPWWKHAAFVVPNTALVAWLLFGVWWHSQHSDPDGAGDLAWYMALCVLSSSFFAYLSLLVWPRDTGAQHRTHAEALRARLSAGADPGGPFE